MSPIHLVIRGRVQGVGFRWFVRETARRLGLSGWVSNRPDGNVELAAGGAEDALEKLRTAVGNGPPGAVIRSVDELPAPEGNSLPTPFTIVR
ncbi:MAG TPA: acylphosphatase [Gemmatimonadaceae bacterium]|nr:acylphosphatase [Gemmatimonadaceae bacterium]